MYPLILLKSQKYNGLLRNLSVYQLRIKIQGIIQGYLVLSHYKKESQMTINELIDGIQKRDIVLPEFQREYVWSREQAKQLMVSLSKGISGRKPIILENRPTT